MMLLAIATATSVALSGDIVLRGPMPTPEGRVIRVDASGVLVAWADQQGPPEQVSLDRVRSVSGTQAATWSQVAPTAERAWRARSRLERGDLAGAEPILESLASEYRDQNGSTAAAVFEGLLRCRLARQAHASAVEPWLSWLACGGSDGSLLGDTATLGSRDIRLVASLPPIWQDSPALRAMIATQESGPTVGTIGSLRSLYLASAQFEIDGIEPPLPPVSGDPAVAVVRDIVIARIGDAKSRASTRDALNRRLSGDLPSWLQAWCRAAIGRSLARESDVESRRRAAIELITVHTEHGSDSPYLAGFALAEAARVCESSGDAPSAAVVWSELNDRYPGHPAANPGAARHIAPRSPEPRAEPETLPSVDEGG